MQTIECTGCTSTAEIAWSFYQIFNGWRHHRSLYDHFVLSTVQQISVILHLMLLNEARKETAVNQHRESATASKNAVVISGAGTSGRLAFLCCRSFNKELGGFWHAFTYLLRHAERRGIQPLFQYLIAGGDRFVQFNAFFSNLFIVAY